LYAQDIRPVEGLHVLIDTLKKYGVKVAVATSGQEKNRIFVLEKLNFLDTFDAIVGEEHVTHGKPHPEVFLKAADAVGIDPKHCLVFEDSPSGVKGAKNAGMRVIGLLTSHTAEELKEADGVIKTFLELEVN
jgi:HAD superfamily hydrolase (TIGR01509 family)